jgi:hypothetical protein
MAALSVANPTLLDLAKVKDPNGSIASVVELLTATNEILQDMTFMEGNLETGHRSTVRTGLPAPTWRKMYGGVQPNKGTTAQVTDNCGMMEAYAEIDKALADLNGNAAAYRLVEDSAHIEGMNIEMADTLFYGNEGSEPEAFTGLSPRYNSLSAANAENIINAGGVGADNNSIWLCVWGPTTGYGILPKGSEAGLKVRDLGEVTVENVDGLGGRMQAYRTHYRWDAGLTIRDWRYFVRIANIDKSATLFDAASGPNLPNLMFEAIERIPNLSAGRANFYMSRYLRTRLRQQSAAAVKSSTLTVEMVGGIPVSMFHGIPIRRTDALSADEALVV